MLLYNYPFFASSKILFSHHVKTKNVLIIRLFYCLYLLIMHWLNYYSLNSLNQEEMQPVVRQPVLDWPSLSPPMFSVLGIEVVLLNCIFTNWRVLDKFAFLLSCNCPVVRFCKKEDISSPAIFKCIAISLELALWVASCASKR